MRSSPTTPAVTDLGDQDPSRWVDALAVQALSGILVRAQTVADGVLAGLHRSLRHGRSIEFAEHKVYAPGDDVRRIDWKAFARFNRYYVRRYVDETALRAFFICDVSNSMAYAGGGPRSLSGVRKADYAKTLCASLAYLLVRQADAVGCMTFAETAGPHVAQRGGERHLADILEELDRAPVGGRTRPAESLVALSRHVSRRSLVVCCTDMMDNGSEVLEPLGAMANRGADVAILQVLHPDELRFPFDGAVRFLDLEGDREAQVDAPAIKNAYLEEIRTWMVEQQSAAWERGVKHHVVDTGESPAKVLLEFLDGRRGGE